MKLHKIYGSLAILVFFSALPAVSRAQESRLEFNLEAANAILALFEAEDPKVSDVEALLEIPGVQATIAQAGRFDKAATAENYVASLYAVLTGQTPAADPFRFARLKSRLDEVKESVEILGSENGRLEEGLIKRWAAYAPTGTAFSTTLYAVVGGTSDAWAPGKGVFYVTLDYFRNDIEGLKAMVAHELYHVIQGMFFVAGQTREPLSPDVRIVDNVIVEGTATLVGNPMNFEGDGPYLGWLKAKHNRNLARIVQNFALFEALYFRASQDLNMPFSPAYSLGFSGGWDSPLYFVGFHIAEGLEKHLGREALVAFLGEKTGIEVLDKYIRVYTETGDESLTRFSPAIENLIKTRVEDGL